MCVRERERERERDSQTAEFLELQGYRLYLIGVEEYLPVGCFALFNLRAFIINQLFGFNFRFIVVTLFII